MSSSPSSINPSINQPNSLQQTLTSNPKPQLSSSSTFNNHQNHTTSTTISTLGNLPRKPNHPNLRINHHPNQNTLNSNNLTTTNPNSSPTSFNKTGLGFGRIGLIENPINNQITSSSNYTDPKKKSINHLKNSHHPSSPITRRLGSFNSLASLPISSSKDSKLLSTDELIDQQHQHSSSLSIDSHPLRFEWVFWILHRSPNKKMNEEEFGKAMKRLGSCNSVETFYPLYLHLKRPSLQTPIADIHLFSNPIKPVWEDPNNVKGGKWTIRLRKGLSDRLWESLVFSLIGGGIEKLIHSSSTNSTELGKIEEVYEQEICGAVLSIRKDEDLMTVWHRNGDNQLSGDGKIAKKVKLAIQTVLQLPLNCNLVYKLNVDSLANGVGQKLTISTGTTANNVGNHNSRLQQQRSLNRKRENIIGGGGGGGIEN